MSNWDTLLSAWHWKPEVLAGSTVLIAGYMLFVRPLTYRAALFVAGVLVLALSLVSPLDTLAHEYLFSAHMAQHLLMVLVVPPLLLLGIPAHVLTGLPGWAAVRRNLLGRPVVTWALATGVMWVWHLPALYGAALESNGIHVLQHLMFLVTAVLFWWPVIGSNGLELPLGPWGAMLYLFLAAAASSVLGIILTFAPPGLYPAYTYPADRYGLLPLVREVWGISAADDQQIGGLLMWIPGGIAYSAAILAVLARWFSEPETDDEESSLVPGNDQRLQAGGLQRRYRVN